MGEREREREKLLSFVKMYEFYLEQVKEQKLKIIHKNKEEKSTSEGFMGDKFLIPIKLK